MTCPASERTGEAHYVTGFARLCEAHLTREETETLTLCGWTVLVLVAPAEDIRVSVEAGHDPGDEESTMVAGAPRVLALAERPAARRPGPWAVDLDTACYVALYLRAAQHSLRRGCPVVHA